MNPPASCVTNSDCDTASGKNDGVQKGDKVLNSLGTPTRNASARLVDAVRVAQNIPAFRRAGLKPSV